MATIITSTFNKERKYQFTLESLHNPLGKGAYAIVIICKSLTDNKLYAAKRLNLNKPGFPAKLFNYEKSNAKQIREAADTSNPKPHVAYAIDECEEITEMQHFYYQIYYLYDAKDLRHYISTVSTIQEDHAWEIIRQVYNGLYFLHDRLNMMHRDIKLDNIFLQHKSKIGNNTFKLDAYLGDFGMSTCEFSATTNCGTPETKAPEVILSTYNRTAEYYSLGIIFYQMLFEGAPPFKKYGDMETTAMGVGSYSINPSFRISDLAIAFIECCLQKNPEERIGEKELFDLLQITALDKPFFIPPSLMNTFPIPGKPKITECNYLNGQKYFSEGPLALYKAHINLMNNSIISMSNTNRDIDYISRTTNLISLPVASVFSVIGYPKFKNEWVKMQIFNK